MNVQTQEAFFELLTEAENDNKHWTWLTSGPQTLSTLELSQPAG